MRSSEWYLLVGDRKGIRPQKQCLNYSLFNMDDNKNGRGTARSTSWATPSAYEKQNDGEPGQTAGQSSCHYEGHRPDALQGRGSRWGGRKNTSSVPGCIRFATWNIGTMTSRSAEVVETLHKRKINVCCVQETRWTGSVHVCLKQVEVRRRRTEWTLAMTLRSWWQHYINIVPGISILHTGVPKQLWFAMCLCLSLIAVSDDSWFRWAIHRPTVRLRQSQVVLPRCLRWSQGSRCSGPTAVSQCCWWPVLTTGRYI